MMLTPDPGVVRSPPHRPSPPCCGTPGVVTSSGLAACMLRVTGWPSVSGGVSVSTNGSSAVPAASCLPVSGLPACCIDPRFCGLPCPLAAGFLLCLGGLAPSSQATDDSRPLPLALVCLLNLPLVGPSNAGLMSNSLRASCAAGAGRAAAAFGPGPGDTMFSESKVLDRCGVGAVSATGESANTAPAAGRALAAFANSSTTLPGRACSEQEAAHGCKDDQPVAYAGGLVGGARQACWWECNGTFTTVQVSLSRGVSTMPTGLVGVRCFFAGEPPPLLPSPARPAALARSGACRDESIIRQVASCAQRAAKQTKRPERHILL